MFTRSSLVGGSILCLLAVGCVAWEETHEPVGSVRTLDRKIEVALDVEVEVVLTQGLHVSGRPEAILGADVASGSGLKLGEVTANGASISFTVRGTKLGEYQLTIEYRDEVGQRRRETFVVAVSEIHDAHARLHCVGWSWNNSVPVGAEFTISTGARDAQGESLPIGDLNVVEDADGFELVNPKTGAWRAPATPGTYTWRLIGKEQRVVELIVYDPADLAVALTVETREVSQRPYVRAALTRQREGDEFDFCLGPRNAKVEVEVVEGACRTAFGNVAFDGPLSFDVASGSKRFWVTGSGQCTLRARTLEGPNTDGAGVETTLDADVSTPVFSSRTYEPLGELSIEVDSVPEGGFTPETAAAPCTDDPVEYNPSCEHGLSSKEGCVEKTAWKIDYVSLDPEADYSAVGAGLTAELGVHLRWDHEGILSREYPKLPADLELVPETSDLQWVEVGCTQDRRIVHITPTVAGDHRVEFDADNALAKHTHTVRAHAVARMSLEVIADPLAPEPEVAAPDMAGPEPAEVAVTRAAPHLPPAVEATFGATVRHLFLGEQRAFRLDYFDAEERRLRGIGKIFVSSSEPQAGAQVSRFPERKGFGIRTGIQPSTILVTSPSAAEAHTIHADGEASIAFIHGLQLARFAVGTTHCLELHPLAEDGLLIEGRWPSVPVVEGANGLLVTTADEEPSQPCFYAQSAGEFELEWTWGNAHQTVTWVIE